MNDQTAIDLLLLQSWARESGGYLIVQREPDMDTIQIIRKRGGKLLFQGFTYNYMVGLIRGYQHAMDCIKELL